MRIATLAAIAAAFAATAGQATPDRNNPDLETARLRYTQCLAAGAARAARLNLPEADAFSEAKADCIGQRAGIVDAAKGHIDVVAALDAIEVETQATFAQRTKAIRAMRVAYRMR